MKSIIQIKEGKAQSVISKIDHTLPKTDVFNKNAGNNAIHLDVYDKSQNMNQDIRSMLVLYKQLLQQHSKVASETVKTIVDTDISLAKLITSGERKQ